MNKKIIVDIDGEKKEVIQRLYYERLVGDVYFTTYAKTTKFNNLIVIEVDGVLYGVPFWSCILNDFRRLPYEEAVVFIHEKNIVPKLGFSHQDIKNYGPAYSF